MNFQGKIPTDEKRNIINPYPRIIRYATRPNAHDESGHGWEDADYPGEEGAPVEAVEVPVHDRDVEFSVGGTGVWCLVLLRVWRVMGRGRQAGAPVDGAIVADVTVFQLDDAFSDGQVVREHDAREPCDCGQNRRLGQKDGFKKVQGIVNGKTTYEIYQTHSGPSRTLQHLTGTAKDSIINRGKLECRHHDVCSCIVCVNQDGISITHWHIQEWTYGDNPLGRPRK